MADASAEPSDGIPVPSIATSLPANGDPAGMRKWLSERGVTYGVVYTSEALGNVSGGIRQGALYGGKLEAAVSANLEKLIGWQGLSFFSNAFQIHRTSGPRDEHFTSLITISNIEAFSSTRLSELWFEQKFFDDRFSIRFGQLTTDAEFFISDYSRMFISSDWPTIMGANVPSGGPAYPLATPGIRWKFDANAHWSMLLGLYNGDPGNQATVNRTGTNFRVNDPPLLMGEVQYRYNQEKDSRGLAGIVRLGGWHHFGKFDDQRFDHAGLSLAHPLSSGIARQFRGTSGIYGIIDQQIYRPEGGGPDSGISVFSRIAGTPSDRNLVNFFLDGGVVFSGMLPAPPRRQIRCVLHLCQDVRLGPRAGPRPDRLLGRRPADQGLRNDDRAQLPGPDQAGLDHAAGVSIHHPSRRSCAGPDFSGPGDQERGVAGCAEHGRFLATLLFAQDLACHHDLHDLRGSFHLLAHTKMVIEVAERVIVDRKAPPAQDLHATGPRRATRHRCNRP